MQSIPGPYQFFRHGFRVFRRFTTEKRVQKRPKDNYERNAHADRKPHVSALNSRTVTG